MDRIKMGNFLIELRKEKDLSQTDLAEIIGVTFQAVSKWERGEAIPDIAILEKLASFYCISIDEIIKGETIVKSEKEIKNYMGGTATIDSNNESRFLHQKRIFGFWFSLVYLVVFFLIGFCPMATAETSSLVGTSYFSVNYYEIVFSSEFSLGNFIFLLQFLTTIGIIACTLLYFTCITKKSFHALFITRFVLIIVNLLTLVMNVGCFFYNSVAVGMYLMFLIILIFDILYLTLKPNRKIYILQDFKD